MSATATDQQTAEESSAVCREWHRLKTEEHYSGNQAASALGKSPSWFAVNFPRWQREGAAAFLPERRELGAARKLFTDLPAWFLPVAKFYYLNTNLTSTRGSVPEAIRCAISMPVCPPAVQRRLIKVCINHGWRPINGEKLPKFPEHIKEEILSRAKGGKEMLPETLTRQITVSAPFVRHHRNPTDAALDYISAGGTQMWITHAETGEKIFIRGGDVVECDDATINFPVCVPWTMRGCPCSEKYEVKVGRFQWLVAIDVGSRRVLGFCYTARPKSSYRAEDVLSLMKVVCRQHGIPRIWRLEKGVWKSNLVINAVKTMGSGRISVHSPHAKPFIEGLFNKLWTKLSVWFPDASVGRFRGENEEANRLLTACQTGAKDPRKYFPMLAEVLEAFHAVIEEHNASLIDSENYGKWVPHDRWNADSIARPLPALNPQTDWIFSPFVRTWTVAGNNVGGRVPLFPGHSVPFQFSAPWLLHFHGAKVKCYFDPSEPRCFATIVLENAWGNHRAGEVLGSAPQTNATTAYIRLVMGWGDDSHETGRNALRQAHSALRRDVRGISGPRVGRDSVESKHQGSTESHPAVVSESEQRDGLGKVKKISVRTNPTETAGRECGMVQGLKSPSTQESGSPDVPANHGRASSVLVTARTDSSVASASAAEDLSRRSQAEADDLKRFETENAHLLI